MNRNYRAVVGEGPFSVLSFFLLQTREFIFHYVGKLMVTQLENHQWYPQLHYVDHGHCTMRVVSLPPFIPGSHFIARVELLHGHIYPNLGRVSRLTTWPKKFYWRERTFFHSAKLRTIQIKRRKRWSNRLIMFGFVWRDYRQSSKPT